MTTEEICDAIITMNMEDHGYVFGTCIAQALNLGIPKEKIILAINMCFALSSQVKANDH